MTHCHGIASGLVLFDPPLLSLGFGDWFDSSDHLLSKNFQKQNTKVHFLDQ